MNWGRGLFRGWLLLSAIWTSFIGLIVYDEVVRAVQTLTYAETPVTDPKILARLDKELFGEGPWTYVYRQAAPEVLMSAASQAFIPPLIVFLIGAGVLWSARGFKK